MTPQAEQLVAEHLDVCKAFARRRMTKYPQCWHDDILSAAYGGLMQAAESFDPDRGWKFWTFAQWRVDGAITDHMRDTVTGRRSASGNNWRNRTNDLSLDATIRTANDEIPRLELNLSFACLDADPAVIVEDDVERRSAVALLEGLHDDDRQLAEWYFADELTMAEIGRRLGVTESRICQRVSAIKHRLRLAAIRADLLAA